MIGKIIKEMQLLELLYKQENRFVDEIDRLEKKPDEVYFIEAENDSGWVCLKAQEDSFDWNIVRLVGEYDKAKSVIGNIPFKEEYVLLLDDGVGEVALTQNGGLSYFENNLGVSSTEDFYLYNNDEINLIGLSPNCIKRRASPFNSRVDDIYLIMKNTVCGYCKVIKTTWHYSEIAIEINSKYRGQGFGSALLGLMVRQFNEKGLKLSYAVEEENVASIKIAEKYLNRVFRLNKYLYLKDDFIDK